VADGLGYAHSLDIVHRDIKPENILLSGGHAVISDFGIARAVSAVSGRITKTGGSVGSPLYMSPEQAAGQVNLDGRGDLYSLACMLYEMLAGEPPFSGQSMQALIAKHAMEPPPDVRVLRASVPEPLDEAIRQALAKSPADRHRTVAEFDSILSKVARRTGEDTAAELVDSISTPLAAATQPEAVAHRPPEDRGFRLRPSFTGGLLGGLVGGVGCGVVTGFLYVEPLTGMSIGEKAWFLCQGVLAGAFTGAAIGTGTASVKRHGFCVRGCWPAPLSLMAGLKCVHICGG